MTVKAIPDGFHTVQTYLIVKDVEQEIAFFKAGLDAQVGFTNGPPGEPLRHAELTVGDSKLMIGRAQDDWPACRTMLYLYVEDCDTVHGAAVKAGGTEAMPLTDQPYGDRHGMVTSPGGVQLCIASHIEDLDDDEIKRRMEEMHSTG